MRESRIPPRLARRGKEQEEKDKAEGKTPLEGIPEEGQAAQNGEASTSTETDASKQPTVEDEKKDDDPDKMDTA